MKTTATNILGFWYLRALGPPSTQNRIDVMYVKGYYVYIYIFNFWIQPPVFVIFSSLKAKNIEISNSTYWFCE